MGGKNAWMEEEEEAAVHFHAQIPLSRQTEEMRALVCLSPPTANFNRRRLLLPFLQSNSAKNT